MIMIENYIWLQLLLHFLFKHQLLLFLTISFVFSHFFLNVKPMISLSPPEIRDLSLLLRLWGLLILSLILLFFNFLRFFRPGCTVVNQLLQRSYVSVKFPQKSLACPQTPAFDAHYDGQVF